MSESLTEDEIKQALDDWDKEFNPSSEPRPEFIITSINEKAFINSFTSYIKDVFSRNDLIVLEDFHSFLVSKAPEHLLSANNTTMTLKVTKSKMPNKAGEKVITEYLHGDVISVSSFNRQINQALQEAKNKNEAERLKLQKTKQNQEKVDKIKARIAQKESDLDEATKNNDDIRMNEHNKSLKINKLKQSISSDEMELSKISPYDGNIVERMELLVSHNRDIDFLLKTQKLEKTLIDQMIDSFTMVELARLSRLANKNDGTDITGYILSLLLDKPQESLNLEINQLKQWISNIKRKILNLPVKVPLWFNLRGKQGRGKSYFLKQLISILGEHNKAEMDISVFADNTQLGPVFRNYAILIEEISYQNRTSIDRVKQIVSEERLSIRLPFEKANAPPRRILSTICSATNNDLQSVLRDTEMRRFFEFSVSDNYKWQSLPEDWHVSLWNSVDPYTTYLKDELYVDHIKSTRSLESVIPTVDLVVNEWIELWQGIRKHPEVSVKKDEIWMTSRQISEELQVIKRINGFDAMNITPHKVSKSLNKVKVQSKILDGYTLYLCKKIDFCGFVQF